MKKLLKEHSNTPLFLRDIWKNQGSSKAWMVVCYFLLFPGYFFSEDVIRYLVPSLKSLKQSDSI